MHELIQYVIEPACWLAVVGLAIWLVVYVQNP